MTLELLEPVLLDNPDVAQRLRAVVETAAAGPDRAGRTSGFLADGQASEDDVASWLERATGERGPRAAAGLNGHVGSIADRLRPVVLATASRPPWVAGLAAFLGAQGEDEPTAAACFRRAAAALLPELPGVAATAAAMASVHETLVGRLGEACQQIAPVTSQEGWLAQLESAPALAYVIGTVCAQWCAAMQELADRLAADLPLLQDRLWAGRPPGVLVGFTGDTGDRHASGRSVALLEFEHGCRVVYKPKELDHVEAFQDLIRFVNAAGLSVPLATRGVVLRGDYGWEETIVASPVRDESEFAVYYRRLGMLVRLVQLLAGRDMWADNLIAAADQPMLIDLECLMFPTPRTLPGAGELAGAAAALDSTVAVGSMVMQPWTSPQDVPVLDIGCLSRAGDVTGAGGRPLLPLPPYRPFLDRPDGRRPADPWQFTDDVVAGYRDMQRVLAAHSAELAAPDGPLRRFKGVWVRHIRRNTWDCYKVIRAVVSPAVAASGITREVSLAGLLRLPVRIGAQERPDLIDVALAEIDGFRDLDIPLFGSRTDSTSLFCADGREIADHFDGTAWDRLLDRVAELPGFDLRWHTAVLESCLDAACDGTERPQDRTRWATRSRSAHRVTEAQLLATAVAVGESVLHARIGTGWIGQTWQPVTGLRNVEVLEPDLASGTAGLSVLLAELYAATGSDRFRVVAERTLDDAATVVEAMPDGPPHQRVAGHAPVLGGFAGAGAVVYALARAGDRMGVPWLIQRAAGLLPVVAHACAASGPGQRQAFSDLPVGRAGLLLNLLRLRGVTGPRPDIDATVRDLAAFLVSETAPRYAHRAADTVPAGPDSVVCALARAIAAAPHLVPSAAIELISGHRFGTRHGDALAHADAAASLPAIVGPLPPAGLPRTADLALAPSSALLGLLARPETASLAVAELIDRHAGTGRWFPDRTAADEVNLGLLTGVGAVALACLQVVDPAVRPLTVLR